MLMMFLACTPFHEPQRHLRVVQGVRIQPSRTKHCHPHAHNASHRMTVPRNAMNGRHPCCFPMASASGVVSYSTLFFSVLSVCLSVYLPWTLIVEPKHTGPSGRWTGKQLSATLKSINAADFEAASLYVSPPLNQNIFTFTLQPKNEPETFPMPSPMPCILPSTHHKSDVLTTIPLAHHSTGRGSEDDASEQHCQG